MVMAPYFFQETMIFPVKSLPVIIEIAAFKEN